jgi:hypothetical protein
MPRRFPLFRRAAVLALAVAVLVSSVGCNATQLASSWKSPQYTNPDYTKVLIITLGKRTDLRRIYEDDFVRQLASLGVQGVQGYTLLPDETDRVDKAALQDAVRRSGAQAVIITRLLKVDEQLNLSPGTAAYPAPGVFGYYDQAWSAYYEPPHPAGFYGGPTVYADTIVQMETNLFDAATSALVWTGTTKTFNPEYWDRDIPDLVKVLLDAMVKDGVFRSPTVSN